MSQILKQNTVIYNTSRKKQSKDSKDNVLTKYWLMSRQG